MHGHAQLVLVRFVDHRAVELGGELLVLAVAIVNPDLDEVHLLRRKLLDRFARLGVGRDPVGTVVRPSSGMVMPRPADSSRAAPGIRSLRIFNATSPGSVPRLSDDA